MLRLIFLLLVGYCVYLIVRGATKKAVQSRRSATEPGEITHKDPVCGVYVTEDDAVIGRLGDRKVYFCSMECLEKYRAGLEKKS